MFQTNRPFKTETLEITNDKMNVFRGIYIPRYHLLHFTKYDTVQNKWPLSALRMIQRILAR